MGVGVEDSVFYRSQSGCIVFKFNIFIRAQIPHLLGEDLSLIYRTISATSLYGKTKGLGLRIVWNVNTILCFDYTV